MSLRLGTGISFQAKDPGHQKLLLPASKRQSTGDAHSQ